MSVLVLMLALPLLAALFIGLARSIPSPVEFGLCTVAAGLPIAVATFAGADTVEFDYLFTMQRLALRLDGTARAALLLFGSLWLAALILQRSLGARPAAAAFLVTLTGTITIAVAATGPLVFTGMLVTGYGMYAVIASEAGTSWHKPARAWVVALVLSDLLVFEILLHAAAHPASGLGPGFTITAVVAIVLRAGLAPAPQWQPPVLPAVSQPTALLAVAVPSAAALIGGQKLLAGAGAGLASWCLAAGLLGAAWAAVAGAAQRRSLPTLGYAAAASSALLLAALPAGSPAGPWSWLLVSLAASCASIVAATGSQKFPQGTGARTAALVVHAIASAEAARLAGSGLPAAAVSAAGLAGALAVMLTTIAVARGATANRANGTPLTGLVAWALLATATIGLVIALTLQDLNLNALWPAPAGIAVGLMLHRWPPDRYLPEIPPGDLLWNMESAAVRGSSIVRDFCIGPMPIYRDRMLQAVTSRWRGDRWAYRIAAIESVLAAWSITAVLVLLTAVAAAVLLFA